MRPGGFLRLGPHITLANEREGGGRVLVSDDSSEGEIFVVAQRGNEIF